MKKKILICGGTGFIGRNLVENLSKNKNYQVFATYNKTNKIKIRNVKWIKGDLRKDSFSKKSIVPDWVQTTPVDPDYYTGIYSVQKVGIDYREKAKRVRKCQEEQVWAHWRAQR